MFPNQEGGRERDCVQALFPHLHPEPSAWRDVLSAGQASFTQCRASPRGGVGESPPSPSPTRACFIHNLLTLFSCVPRKSGHPCLRWAEGRGGTSQGLPTPSQTPFTIPHAGFPKPGVFIPVLTLFVLLPFPPTPLLCVLLPPTLSS